MGNVDIFFPFGNHSNNLHNFLMLSSGYHHVNGKNTWLNVLKTILLDRLKNILQNINHGISQEILIVDIFKGQLLKHDLIIFFIFLTLIVPFIKIYQKNIFNVSIVSKLNFWSQLEQLHVSNHKSICQNKLAVM